MNRTIFSWAAGLMISILVLMGQAQALTSPQIVEDPTNPYNKVVRLETEKTGDFSWMEIPFSTLVNVNYDEHELIIVSFDIYRPFDSSQEWFYWTWTAGGQDPIDPIYGGQTDETFPFIGTVTTNTAPNIYDRWVNVTLVLELLETPEYYSSTEYTGPIHGWVYSDYDYTSIDIAFPLILNNTDPLTGYFFGLAGFSDEPDAIYIDNFFIEGSEIYDSNGFEGMSLGDLDGQDGWLSGAYSSAVPLPSSFGLLTLGILGIAGINRRRKDS